MKRFLLIALCLLTMPFAASAQMKATFGNPLVDAADQGIEALVSAQIRNGNEVNVRGNFGVTPLMRAAYRNYVGIMEMLINLGADVNTADEGGATALHLAARQGNVEAVKLLLKYDSMIDMADSEGWTPLMRATAGQKREVAEVLLEAGANSQAKNEWGDTPQTFAEKSPADAPLLAMMKRADSKHVSKLTAVEAVKQNISLPVEQVLPRDLPVDEKIAMPNPKTDLLDTDVFEFAAPETAPKPNGKQAAESGALRQQIEAEKLATAEAQAKLQAAIAAREQHEANTLEMQQAEIKKKLAEQQRAEAEKAAQQEALLAQAQLESRIAAEKRAAAAAEQKAALLAEENAKRATEQAQQEEIQRQKQAALERQQMERQLLEQQLARQATEEKLRQEIARQRELAAQERQLAAIAPAAGSSLPTSENILIGEAIAVPVSSNPLVVAAANPRPSLLKVNKGVWLQVGPFVEEQAAVAYYDRAIQSMTDLLPQRMKVITTSFLSDGDPLNFLRLGPYNSQNIAELACSAFRHSELFCQYVREEASDRYNRGRL
jgi:hypothetical protein